MNIGIFKLFYTYTFESHREVRNVVKRSMS